MSRRRNVAPLDIIVKQDGTQRKKVRVPGVEETVIRADAQERKRFRPVKNPANDLTAREEAFAATVVPRMLAGERGAIGETAKALGYKSSAGLMRNPAVMRAVDENMNAALDRVDAETAWLLDRLKSIVNFDVRELMNDDGSAKMVSEIDDETAAAIQAVEVEEMFEGAGAAREQVGYLKKYKVSDRLAAIRLFLEFKKLIGTSRLELTGKDGAPLTLAPPVINVNFVTNNLTVS